jgi:site-specific recombinase XerD
MANKESGVFERQVGSGIWWIRYVAHDGRRITEKVGRRSDAITLIGKRRAEKLERRKLPEKFRRGLTFGELSNDALQHSREQNGERTTAELKLKLDTIGKDFDHLKVEDITKKEIQDWLLAQTTEREWSAATRNRWHAAFSLVFRVGVDNDKIESNPARAIKRKKEGDGRTRFLSDEEEPVLVDALRERFPEHVPALLVSLHTGLRSSEQFRLQWRDINFAQKQVTARATKNGDPERHVPLNSTALKAFEELKAKYPSQPTRFAPVFLNSDGNRLRGHRDWFDPILEAVEDTSLADYHWHCNRHTTASRLVMAGVNLKAVQAIMGHKTIAMTMRYAHLAPNHLESAMESISSEAVATRMATESKTYQSVSDEAGTKRKETK